MVRVPWAIRNKVESCSDKHYNDCWYSDFSSSGAEKSRHQGVVITSGAFTLTSMNKVHNVGHITNFLNISGETKNRISSLRVVLLF